MGGARPSALRRRTGALLLCALASWLAGCSESRPPSFVLVLVDALRADHLGENAGRRPAHTAALAERGIWFERAFATAPWTLPSLASLFVSQLGSQHRVVIWGSSLPAEHETLAEVLRAHGYRTGAWTANVLIGPDTGFAQGFEIYDVVFSPAAARRPPGAPFPNAPAEQVTRRALRWIRALREKDPEAPFFAYLHFMEPHTPYRCPDPRSTRCAARAAALNERLMAEEWNFEPEEQALIRRLYRSEVTRVERALGRLAEALESEALREHTWLVVTADHGEQLGEIGAYLHGKSLDQREIHVPLVFRGPPARGARIEQPVSLIDVAPTLLALARIEQPASFHGRSLVPALDGRALDRAPAIAEIFQTTTDPPRHRLAVIRGDEKLVLGYDGSVSRFDLRRDPQEASPRPATRAELSHALGEREQWIDLGGAPEAPPLDAATRERLRALGYQVD
jgi:arylsulfatase A-like enzyme